MPKTSERGTAWSIAIAMLVTACTAGPSGETPGTSSGDGSDAGAETGSPTCKQDEDCDGGTCVEGACVGGPCSFLSECEAGQYCGPDHHCIADCNATTPCPAGKSCDEHGRCIVLDASTSDGDADADADPTDADADVHDADAEAEAAPLVCTGSRADCDQVAANGCEVDLAKDAAHCGACDHACGAGETCDARVCQPASCPPGKSNCDGSCGTDVTSDPANCGACGHACSLPNATPTCTANKCAVLSCDAGWADCDQDPADGCEIDLTTNPSHCGACSKPCTGANATETCAASQCVTTSCLSGWKDCNQLAGDGCETSITTTTDCGDCGKACAPANAVGSCGTGGSCAIGACNAGWADCDQDPSNGCETDLGSPAACGACGNACHSGACVGGLCTATTCDAGWADCDRDPSNGCETNLGTTPSACGSCGNVCHTSSCAFNGCTGTCDTGWDDCDKVPGNGCEVDLRSSRANCGACNHACATGQVCSNSVCCASGKADCTGTIGDCETNTVDDPNNCGGCGVKCTPGATCAGGTCIAPSCTGGGPGRDDCGQGVGQDCCASLPIDGGTFRRSYDGTTTGYTDPQWVASVSDFRLDAYEVTVGRFRKFVDAWVGANGATPWRPAPGSGKHVHLNGGAGITGESGWQSGWAAYLPTEVTEWGDATHLGCQGGTWTAAAGANEAHPANCVDWYSAAAFCIWDGGFLPTEAEWNYAASGGAQQRVYPWSDPPQDPAVYDRWVAACVGANSCTPARVGSKAPGGDGRWGHSDLAGNVYEWVLDGYADPYAEVPCTDCSELSVPTGRRSRRGGWAQQAAASQLTSLRDSLDPASREPAEGFRCARVPCQGDACGVACSRHRANCDGDVATGNGCEVNLDTDAKHCGACGRACPSGWSCNSGRCITQLDTRGRTEGALASNGTYIVYTGASGVWRVPIGGGAIAQVASSASVAPMIAADSANVYWIETYSNSDGDGYRLNRSAVGGGLATVLAAHGASCSLGCFEKYPRALSLATGAVIESWHSVWAGYTLPYIQSVPAGGGTSTELPNANNAIALAPKGSTVYYVEPGNSGGLRSDAIGASAITKLWNYPVPAAADLCILGNDAYVAVQGTAAAGWSDGLVIRIDLGTGPNKKLASNVRSAVVATDGTYVYWADQGTLYRYDPTTGTTTTLLTGRCFQDLAVDAKGIYWLDCGTSNPVMQAEK